MIIIRFRLLPFWVLLVQYLFNFLGYKVIDTHLTPPSVCTRRCSCFNAASWKLESCTDHLRKRQPGHVEDDDAALASSVNPEKENGKERAATIPCNRFRLDTSNVAYSTGNGLISWRILRRLHHNPIARAQNVMRGRGRCQPLFLLRCMFLPQRTTTVLYICRSL